MSGAIKVKRLYIKSLPGHWRPGGRREADIPSTPFIYVLRTFPELSETFILREMRALMAAGVPVWVLAAACGRRPDLVQAGPGDPLPPVSYLGGRGRTAAPGSSHGRTAAGRPRTTG